MKYEKLDINSGNKYKWLLCGLIMGVLLIIIINLIFSYAKYKVVDSVKLASGTINYESADLNIIAMYIQKNKGDTNDSNYKSITSIPTNNYKLNTTKSYCIKPSTSDSKITGNIVYNGTSISVDNITERGTKCYLYFDLFDGVSITDLIKEQVNNVSDGCPAYEVAPSITSVENTRSLLCKGIDDFGDTYYYRGVIKNNWVKFGKEENKDIYWRIIRINGNDSIRLIYSGTGSPSETGEKTQISTSSYNTLTGDALYVIYAISTIKSVLNLWYNTNLKIYADKIDGAAGFCNDTDKGTTNSLTGVQYNKPSDRLDTSKKPTLKCGTPAFNLFTTNGETNGNQDLTNPIGLITADEVSFAGGLLSGINNSDYYLYTNQYYWTMSPNQFWNGKIYMFHVDNSGRLGGSDGKSEFGVRPVINLKANTKFEVGGEGTIDNPYVVVTD